MPGVGRGSGDAHQRALSDNILSAHERRSKRGIRRAATARAVTVGGRWQRMHVTLRSVGVGAHALVGLCVSNPLSAQSTLLGTVLDSLNGRRPLSGATVVLVERNRTATTDSRGQFRFDSVPAGAWTLSLMHPALDLLELTATSTAVALPGHGTTMVELATPSATTLLSRMCPSIKDSTTGLLFGHVRVVGDGRWLAGARIAATWRSYTVGREGVRYQGMRVSTTSNERGVYVLCGVPTDTRAEVTVTHNTRDSGPIEAAFDTLSIRRRDVTIALEDSLFGDVVGVVRFADGQPVAEADLRVRGSEKRARTGQDGRFRFARVPSGTRGLDARHVGQAPVHVSVDVPVSAEVSIDVTFDRAAQRLPTVTVAGSLSAYRREGFDERSQSKRGFFLSAEQIGRINVWDMADLIYRAPWIQGSVVNGRRRLFDDDPSAARQSCSPKVYLNGRVVFENAVMPAIELLTRNVRPEDVYGLEMYRPVGYTPRQFRNPFGCGSIVVWTK